MYSKEEQAIRLVIKAFENKKRVKEDINMAVHSITVGFMLKNIGCDEVTVISGLLHDIIEDTTFDYNYLEKEFGSEIANNVLILSEDKTIIDWKLRKKSFIDNLSRQKESVIIVELADRFHNLLSDYSLWLVNGNKALTSLNANYEDNRWYYLEMQKLFNNKLNNNVLLERYNEICDLYFK